jgi:hypothetical protein
MIHKFKLFLENKDKIKSLGEQLKHIDTQKYSILGHGTTNTHTAQSIINSGLKYSEPNLDRQAIPLFDSKSPIENQIDNLKSILNWTHKNSKAIVIIGIPNPQKEQRGGDAYFQSVWDKIPHNQLTDIKGNNTTKTSLKYIIKPEYLMGYIDTESTTFIPNPNFNPTPIKSNKWWSNPIQNITKPKFTNIPQINQNNQKYPEVW